MKKVVLAAVVFVLLVGCTKVPATPGTTTPPVALSVLVATFQGGCPLAATFVTSPQVKALLAPGGLCVTTANQVAAIVAAKGTVAQIEATLMALQNEITSLPSTIPAKDIQYAQGALALGQIVLSAYAAATGQTL
jgi:hypothetical protein